MIRVAHLITDLSTGGAETMLYRLVEKMDRGEFSSLVISLSDVGPVGEEIRKLGIQVESLGMSPGRPSPVALWKLTRLLRVHRPQILQTWLYHADLLGLMNAALSGRPKVAWNLRCSDMDLTQYSQRTGLVLRACAALSHLPAAVIVNSDAGRRHHLSVGYRPRRWELIPNGFDLDRFRPDPSARKSLGDELGLPEDALLVGLVARFDPMKDHATFLEAAARVHKRHDMVHFVLCGTRVDRDNAPIAQRVDRLGLSPETHLLGERYDVPRITAALDIACSSSITEGFPTAVGEAMACGVPCAVTDAGDSAVLLGDSGIVVPPGNPEALAAALDELIQAGPARRAALGMVGRRRVETSYSLSAIVARYEQLYKELVA
jgi:glycosyltransferase involved in cell wall biosynthesis